LINKHHQSMLPTRNKKKEEGSSNSTTLCQ